MKENLNALDELNKGCTMGTLALNITLKYVEDSGLKEELIKEYANYDAVSDKVRSIYKKHSTKNPHEVNIMNKIMASFGIKMKLMKDNSNSKIAELLIQGTTMGIIEGRKMLNSQKHKL